MEELTCQCCQKPFIPEFRRKKFCSTKCNRRAYYLQNYTPSIYEKQQIGRSNVGAANELRVAADLILRGFDVFRALSPQWLCDLAVLRNGKLWRVEVRTGQPSKRRVKPFWPKKKQVNNSDIYAVVLPDQIYYEPSLDTLTI